MAINFYLMATTTEEWECPSCHNVAFMNDHDRALRALGMAFTLTCTAEGCGKTASGLAVKTAEGTDYSFSECG